MSCRVVIGHPQPRVELDSSASRRLELAARGDAAPGLALPPRYEWGWRAGDGGWWEGFVGHAAPAMLPGAQILDVGSGRRPIVPSPARPPGSTYVGLDISEHELRAAPPGSYDEMVCGDVAKFQPELAQRFDLILSWQVLEHVKPLDKALQCIHSYSRAGGHFVAVASGSYSVFGILNRLVPHRLAIWGMRVLLGRDPETVFPAHYDRCHYSALVRLLAPWKEVQVIPAYRGAPYFSFSKTAQAAYLRYESWAARTQRRNLATHYLIAAVK